MINADNPFVHIMTDELKSAHLEAQPPLVVEQHYF